MRSIFFNNIEKDQLEFVYNEATIKYLEENAGFERRVVTRDYAVNHTEEFKDVDYIFSTWGMPEMSEEEIKEIFPALKCVFYAAGSVQKFARPFLNCGVKVFSAWAANAVPVAEYTVAQIILAGKGFFSTSVLAKEGKREEAGALFRKYPCNYGETIGIIGAGMIGKLVINMLHAAYKFNVIVFDPFLPDEKAKELGVEKVSLKELFERSFIVSNHLANNAETQGMLKYEHFSSMRPYSTFINTGRGAQVVEDDLCKVLEERKDITALLDVTWPEPPVEGHKFYSLPNCILTPHIAGSAGMEVFRMSEFMVDEFNKFTKGEKTQYEVTHKMLETMA